MRKYLFCRSGPACGVRSQTLFTSLVGRSQLSEDEAERQISLLSASFPETENRFRALANDFFNAVKLRWQNRQRYLVSLRSGLSYGSQAFGPLSVTAGAVAFGITFTAVELLESLTLGPLHWVCQANWFWAASIGLTVAGFSRDLKGWLSKASSARVTWTSFLDWRAARMVARDPGLFIADQSADFEAVRYHDGLRKLTQADPIGFGVRSWMNRDELLWSLQVREILQRSAGSEVRLARHKIGWDGRPALDIDRLEFDQLVDRLSKPLEVQTQTAILRALLRSEVDRALLQAQLQTVAVTRSGEKRVPQHHQVKTWIKRLGQLDHGLRLMELRQTKQVKFQEELGLSKETSFPEEIQTWIENLWEAESAPSTTARQCASAF